MLTPREPTRTVPLFGTGDLRCLTPNAKTRNPAMATDRRSFLKQASIGLAATGLGAGNPAETPATSPGDQDPGACRQLSRQGPKEVIRGKRAVASSQSPIVTETMLSVMKAGGNAVDACIAGAVTQATVQIDMTNHTGTVSFLYWEAKTGKTYYLNSMGTLHPTLPPFRTYPAGLGGVAAGPPMACIPGFMPGMAAMHERFGTKSWKSLVEPAIPWAENGFPVDEFTRGVLDFELEGNTYFPAMRELYAPTGFTPSVGEKLRNPALAKTLRHLADEGPEYFTKGDWAKHFVATANTLGWQIKLADLTANPPRWTDPIKYSYKGYEIVQPTPPERQGVFCCLVLGILKHLDIAKLGHYTESAESLYYMAHALRRAQYELGQLYDPEFFDVPADIWMADDFHGKIAEILRRSRPKAGVDLTKHVELTTGRPQLQAFGWATSASTTAAKQPSGSCELTCVDSQGNWVQMMNTLQSGGIPGMVVDGVPMIGSHANFSMAAAIQGWLGVPGSRMRSVMGNTIVMKDGKPVLSMGTPGNVHCTIPQMLSSVLDYGKDPYEAAVLPRMLPMQDDSTIEIENRIPTRVLADLVKLGAKLKPLPPFDFHMGSFQQAWRDPSSGLLNAGTDPRRAGMAGGI
ncbi:MAG: gamma-glutamyltransferase [Gemmatimonadota bacterium]